MIVLVAGSVFGRKYVLAVERNSPYASRYYLGIVFILIYSNFARLHIIIHAALSNSCNFFPGSRLAMQ